MSKVVLEQMGHLRLGILMPTDHVRDNPGCPRLDGTVALGTEMAWLCDSGAHRLYQGQPWISWMSGVAIGTTDI